MKLHEGQRFEVMSEVYTIEYIDRSSDLVMYRGLDDEMISSSVYKVEQRIKLGIWTEIKRAKPKYAYEVMTLVEVEVKK